MRVADRIMQRLADAGVRHIFLLPGGGAMHLNDALALEGRLEAVHCHHEQACGIAAEAYGRTGYPGNPGFGVALVTTGPGATNILTPVVGAWLDSIPMIVISGQVKRIDRIAGRGIRQGGVQEVDVLPMVRGVTKYAVTVESPEEIDEILDRAFELMLSGRPGPVWIEVPLDVQGAPVKSHKSSVGIPTAIKSTGVPADKLMAVMGRLSNATRPLVLAGHGVRLSNSANDFLALCDRWNIPVVTTWNAMDLLPYSHPLNVGRPGAVALRGPNFAVQNADVLLSIGCRFDNVVTAYDPKNFGSSAYKVMVDVDEAELIRAAAFTDMQICCDAADAIKFWLTQPALGGVDRRHWLNRCNEWKQRYPARRSEASFASEGISHYELIEALSAEIPSETLVATGSSGLAVEVFYTAFQNKIGQRIFLTSGLGSMGYGLPSAIGACLGSDRRPMVAVEGDGSLMLNLQEFATLATQKLPILLVVVDNQGYASIRNTQRNYFDSRYIASSAASGLGIPDIASIARSFGVPATTVTQSRELRSLLKVLLRNTEPNVLVVKVIPDESLEPKVSAMPQSDGSIKSMPLEDMSPLLPLDELKKEMLTSVNPVSISARFAKE